MQLSEKQVQELLADFPWLLNINYRRVPELENKGMEYVVSDGRRIDLVLKDSITERPVIVELKAVPFCRENIGQILEYRSRLVVEMSRDGSGLAEAFGNKLSSPVLILVVSEIDDEARLACNLSGIEVYAYNKPIREFVKPDARRNLEEMTESLDKSVLPATEDRNLHIEKLDNEIRDLMSEMNMEHGFKKHRYSGSEYLLSLAYFFINRWLFTEQKVSIGIYEDIFSGGFADVAFDFWSDDRLSLEQFREELGKSRGSDGRAPEITVYENDDGGIEHIIHCAVNKAELLNRPKAVLRPRLTEYAVVMKSAFGVDVGES